jgi:uncharacterized protein YnzC (UPF0291/DUF896 family)
MAKKKEPATKEPPGDSRLRTKEGRDELRREYIANYRSAVEELNQERDTYLAPIREAAKKERIEHLKMVQQHAKVLLPLTRHDGTGEQGCSDQHHINAWDDPKPCLRCLLAWFASSSDPEIPVKGLPDNLTIRIQVELAGFNPDEA